MFAPNNGSAAFTSITLNLGGVAFTFTGAQIVKNGSQEDNVFVQVPASYALGDLLTSGASASYTGSAPTKFVLSHLCPGTPTTTTTEAPTTTTSPDPTVVPVLLAGMVLLLTGLGLVRMGRRD